MRPPEHLLVSALALQVRVSNLLPYMSKDEDGHDAGMVHWLHSGGVVLVSQEMFDKLKALPNGKAS